MSMMRNVSMRMDPEVHDWLKAEAKRRHTSVSALMHEALVDHIEASKLIESLGGRDMIREALRKQLEGGDKDEG